MRAGRSGTTGTLLGRDAAEPLPADDDETFERMAKTGEVPLLAPNSFPSSALTR